MVDLGTHDGVNVQRDDAVLTVTLAQPENRNAQTPATWRRLAEVESLVDDQTRVVVLRAEGKSFSAGLDRRMMTADGVPGEPSILSLAGLSANDVDGFIRQAQAGFTWWGRTHAITIAAVQGHAIGAGFQLALACDLLIAADDAQFAMRETSLGLVPDLGGTYPLVRRLGYPRALELCASGRFVSAGEAVALGLALSEHPVEDLDAALTALVESLQLAPAGAVRELKPLLRHAIDATHEGQLAAERTSQFARIADLRRMLGG
jgi:enoyl-CoA hydratase/carnithine racemase